MKVRARKIVPRSIVSLLAALTLATGSAVVTAGSAAAAPVKLSQSEAASQLSAAGIPELQRGLHHPEQLDLHLAEPDQPGQHPRRDHPQERQRLRADHHRGHRGRPRRRHLQPLQRLQARLLQDQLPHNYITDNFTYIGLRSKCAEYRAASGNVYDDEGNHWDVTFYNCGC